MKRPWFVRYDSDGQTRICDPDFTYDVELVVTGDFPSQEQRSAFANALAKRLSEYPEVSAICALDGCLATEITWLEDELMEVMRIVAPGMGGPMPDEINFAIMVTAIRRLMEADTERYEAMLERWQRRQKRASMNKAQGK